MEQANRLAFGKVRWKVVTLDGKVIDRSGTMSGGGNRIQKGALSGKLVHEVQESELKKLEKEKVESEAEWNQLKYDTEALQAEIKGMEKEVVSLKELLDNAATDQSCLEKQLEAHQKQVKVLRYHLPLLNC